MKCPKCNVELVEVKEIFQCPKCNEIYTLDNNGLDELDNTEDDYDND